MVQNFCKNIKLPFMGDQSEYELYNLDIENVAPALLQYVSEETKYKIEENDWIIEIKYYDVKEMFDIVINKIISLIRS